jgi:hypothetical protein
MVNTDEMTQPNGNQPVAPDRRLSLPEAVTLTQTDMRRMPSPGTQRALKAETGKDFMALIGPDADNADRTQTQIWLFLRRTMPDLRWAECDGVDMIIDEAITGAMDPTRPASSEGSLPSAASGG